MAFDFKLGGGSSSTKTKTYIDPKTSAAQWGNWDAAQSSLARQYTPTSAAQIGGYFDPYVDQVVDKSLASFERSRQMAVNATGDAADRAKAFGGSRHGVAESLTNERALDQAGLLAAQLFSSGWGQALGAAQQENQFGFAYPLQAQQTLNQTLAGIEPMRTTKSKGTNVGASFGYSGGAPMGS